MRKKNSKEKIENLLKLALDSYFDKEIPGEQSGDFDLSLQSAKDKSFGDLTSNISMRIARRLKKRPDIIAKDLSEIITRLRNKSIDEYAFLDKVEPKGGFINIWYSARYFEDLIRTIYTTKEDYGKSDDLAGDKVNIEFVSANPTGPLTIAHGRQAAIGDALASILRFVGSDVTTEYYLNDYGRQIKMLGISLKIRYRNLFGKDDVMPEDGYMGNYIHEIAEKLKSEKGDSLLTDPDSDDIFMKYAVSEMMKTINKDLDDFRVHFDVWTKQSGIEERDEVNAVLKDLEEGGFIYEKDGAKWFRSTDFDDDKDRVVVKSDGPFTYLAPDIAYHKNKYSRGFTKLIDLLGPDHHGYINRMKAAVQAMGHDEAALDILIVQLVTLMRGGEPVRMSTRKGEFITLREIIDEIGADVARFFFLMRKLDSHLDFDIELAKKESSDNPVFYIQYAYARICSMSRFAKEQSIDFDSDDIDLSLLSTQKDKDLIRKLGDFPQAVLLTAEFLEPSRLITYLTELASNFHSFYGECRVISEDQKLSNARIFLVECVRIVIANGLNLLNISLPEKM